MTAFAKLSVFGAAKKRSNPLKSGGISLKTREQRLLRENQILRNLNPRGAVDGAAWSILFAAGLDEAFLPETHALTLPPSLARWFSPSRP
jgi:hypothetical protein